MIKLLIVESPAKCKKIQGFLGAGWRVQATMGHIRTLKEDLTAIGFSKTAGIDQSWAPSYEAIATKKATIAALKQAAKGADVYLGSDDDREGEAIAWHTCQALGLDPTTTKRVTFHEITETALRAAVASPGRIDTNKFEAQQARTMLDMLIGFTLSPCLWKGVGYKPGLSAGRCQTPALRIIYDRDLQIEAHKPTLSWKIGAEGGQLPQPWGCKGQSLSWTCNTGPSFDERTAMAALTSLASQNPKTLLVTDRVERVASSAPPQPFITSSLQQEASSRLSMNPKATMKAAQTLYEGGHITYMRTDSTTLSQEARDSAAELVTARWGAQYLGPVPVSVSAPVPVIKSKGRILMNPLPQNAHEASGSPDASARILMNQNAHECIRPTHFEVTELADAGTQEQRLYKLIWTRTIQSIMAAETRDAVTLKATASTLHLETSWSQTRFAGYRVLDAERKAEEEATAVANFEARKDLVKGQQIPWTLFTATEVRCSPPPRYTEAALISDLERKGIGRPSTYATLVETVLDRGYVEKATIAAAPVQVRGLELKATAKAPKATTKVEKMGGEKDKLRVTALGRTVIEWLLAKFGDILTYDFTATLESRLDEVAKGSRAWPTVLQDTWSQYAERYTEAMSAVPSSPGPGPSQISANKKDFGDGYKLVVSKKGPLFVLEVEGQKTRFAQVPNTLSIQSATRADAEAAFSPTQGQGQGQGQGQEAFGTLDGEPVIKKKGPYGFYVSWKGQNVTCKPDETFAEVEPRLRAKTAPDAVDHTVGPYKIRKGPYGLYMFKSSGGKAKPIFVSIPETTPWSTLTLEAAEQVYTLAKTARKKPAI